MNNTTFQKNYIAAVRSISAASILAIAATVVRSQYLIMWAN